MVVTGLVVANWGGRESNKKTVGGGTLYGLNENKKHDEPPQRLRSLRALARLHAVRATGLAMRSPISSAALDRRRP
jgi:hypothetical protein